MEEQLIQFETAKLAKEKGFDEIVDLLYDTYNSSHNVIENINGLKHSDGDNPFVSATTQSILQRWLREVHNIEIDMTTGLDLDDKNEPAMYQCFVTTNISRDFANYRGSGFRPGYEKVLEEGLKEALKLI